MKRRPATTIGDVALAPSNPDIVWIGTGEANPRNSASWGDGAYKSTDGGKTWKNMGLKDSFDIGQIAIHPTDPNIVLVGASRGGLWRTTNNGTSWTAVGSTTNTTFASACYIGLAVGSGSDV